MTALQRLILPTGHIILMTNDNARDFRPDTVDVNDENPGIPLLGMRSKNGSLEVMAVVKRARISTRVSAVRFYAALDLCARCSKPDSQA